MPIDLATPIVFEPIVAEFLRRLAELSKGDWQSIRVRSKDTKAYSAALNDISRNSLRPAKRAAWEAARAEAVAIARRQAPVAFNSPDQFADVAADAVGALAVLYPWEHSFERLYGPFSGVIPIAAIDPQRIKLAAAVKSYVPPLQNGGLVDAGSQQPRYRKPVDYGRAVSFFGGEIAVLLIWLLVGVAFESQYGAAGWIVGGMPAAAAFLALKVSRGPIASIQMINYQRRLVRLRSSDETTYAFVKRWRDRATAVGALLVVIEIVLVLGVYLANR